MMYRYCLTLTQGTRNLTNILHSRFYDLLQMVEFYQLNKGSLNTRLTHFVVRKPLENSSDGSETAAAAAGQPAAAAAAAAEASSADAAAAAAAAAKGKENDSGNSRAESPLSR